MRLLLLPLLAALLLAGCAAPEADPARAEEVEGEPAGAAAPDARPAEADLGHMPHMHDYWVGRERVTLFDDVVDPGANEDPFMPFYGLAEGQVGRHVWRFPDDAIVMEGTGRMELTATWSDPLVTGLAVHHRVGAAAEWSEPLGLASGKTAAIDVTPAMTDMPHTSTSRWQLLFVPEGSPGALLAPFELRVEIVKMRDIMAFPAHPDLFEGKPEKTLHDRAHEHAEVSYAKRAPNVVTKGEFGEKTVAPDELVPMETLAMRVELSVTDASATPGEVTDIRFFYRGADTSYLGHPYVLPLEGSLAEGRLVYQFPVTMEQTDSPYSETSQWLFFVEPVTKFSGHAQEPTCGGCTDVAIQYHLRVVAYDHELDAYSKMEGED